MEKQMKLLADEKFQPAETSLEMLKRVLAVAELVAKSKQSLSEPQPLSPVCNKKHKS